MGVRRRRRSDWAGRPAIRSPGRPPSALVGLSLFGREFKRWLADRPDRVKVGPVEAVWGRQAARVEAGIDQAALGAERPANAPLIETLHDAADVAPLAAVTEAAAAVEAALVEKLAAHGVRDADVVGIASLANRAAREGLISEETREGLNGLSVMRALALHGRDRDRLTSERAREFVALADGLIFVINRK